jgi:hypothetical protein
MARPDWPQPADYNARLDEVQNGGVVTIVR